MKILIKNELERAFKNKWFYITIFICFAICMYGIYTEVIPYRRNMDTYINVNVGKYQYPVPNLYHCWMELTGHSVVSKLLHFIFPILVCIPYAMSMYTDVDSKYSYSIFVRVEKKKYFLSKLIVQFIVGFTVVMFTMVISFLVTAAVMPAGTPFKCLNYGKSNIDVFGPLFFKAPLFVSVVVMFLQSVFFAIIGCLSYTFAYLLNNEIVVMISPFIIYFFENVVTQMFDVMSLYGCSFFSRLNWECCCVMLVELAVITAIVVITYFMRSKKKDEL